MEAPPAEKRKNLDIECLKCGAMNIAENRICGRCGANLPLVYDQEGNVSHLSEPPRLNAFSSQGARRGLRFSPTSTGWALRFAVILFALLFALLILHHR